MINYDHLLALAKTAAQNAIYSLLELEKAEHTFFYDSALPREMKVSVDYQLEMGIIEILKETGIPIISEEAGDYNLDYVGGLRWIVDPLDGSVNFFRGLPNSATSIALWRDEFPIFGVICEYPSCKLIWGGKSYGAFLDGKLLQVSAIDKKNEAVLCTGFPSRFNFSNSSIESFLDSAKSYAKVRMMGAASISLFNLAKGSADVYLEDDIMIWDVAAGIAIVEGAGGRVMIQSGRFPNSMNIQVDNGLILKR